MLTITIPENELYDEVTSIVTHVPETTIRLEHSLVSISKWEAKYKKPFISKLPQHAKTKEETIDYIRFMTITQNVDPNIYYALSSNNYKEIMDYIEDPMTASWVNDDDSKIARNGEQITSELIYWWMTALEIPWEAQKWHLNRLMMLIRIGNVKSQPPEKKSRSEILARNRALNEARKKKFNTKG